MLFCSLIKVIALKMCKLSFLFQILFGLILLQGVVFLVNALLSVGEWGWGVEGKQVGSMDEESQVRGCYNITFICTPTNQQTVSVLEKTQANKTFRT